MGFSPKQMEILEFPYTKFDGVIADGTIRSGKTMSESISFILWAMANFRNQNFVIASVSIQTAERNVVKPLQNIRYLHEQFIVKYLISSSLLIIARGNKVNYFYVFGGKDEKSFTTVQGITAAGCLLDEVPLMPESFVNQVIARCSVPGSKYFFNCNPVDPQNWFYKKYILKAKEKNLKYLHFTMDDNPNLAQEIKERYEKMYEGVFYDRYIKGLWTKAEGIIYRKFADNPENYIIDEVPKNIMMLQAGVDFGGTKSAHAFVLTGFTDGLNEVVVLESVRITEELDPAELDKRFCAFSRTSLDKYKKVFPAYCDNAEPVLIKGLKNAVINQSLAVSVYNARKNPVNQRIDLVIKLIGTKRLKIMRNCESFIEALGQAVWSEKKEDLRLDDGTSDIDTLDAFEYSIEKHMNQLLGVMSS